jgi:hypothetical protein
MEYSPLKKKIIRVSFIPSKPALLQTMGRTAKEQEQKFEL